MPPIYRQLIVFAIITLLNGCANVPKISPEQRAQLEQPARQYMAQGAWREAAIAWQQAAKQSTGDAATGYRLNAAKALLAAGDGDGARSIVRALKVDLSPRTSIRAGLILAEADLLSGNAEAALRRLGPAFSSKQRDLQAQYHRLRAEALLITGQTLAAIRERTILEAYLKLGSELYSNRQSLWAALVKVDDTQLRSVALQPLDPFSGWVDLAKRVRRHAEDVQALQSSITEWNQNYPAHPAGEEIVPQLLEQALTQSQPPTRIALLLPLSGPFKAAAIAIRDGVLAAWFADAPNPQRPELIFKDSSTGDISNTYNEAITSGAQFIIGPLAKQQVTQLLQTSDIQVPTLSLNYPQQSPDSSITAVNQTSPVYTRPVYQFALAPEDEAAQAADHAFSAGYRNAAILAPQGPWGERVAAAFNQAWNRLGGQLVVQQFYSQNAKEVSDSVKQMLNFDQSEERARRLRRVLGRKFKHDAEPRHDIDVIFIAAFPEAARQIKPLLRFYRAGELPVIATSHIFTGIKDARADQDLDGIEFADMPWILSPEKYGLPAMVQTIWPAARGTLGRLYAFGADAYTLATRPGVLRKISTERIQGLTGALWMDPQGRVQRGLQWAFMEQGVPRTITPAQ